VDFALGDCAGGISLYAKLNSNDHVEVALRHLSAYVCESRTRDSVGAARLRAVVAPGSAVDVAPNWLISEATAHSKMEHQREERISSEIRRRQHTNKGDFKGSKGTPKGGAPPKGKSSH
jgi:hypothetical protein